MVAVVVAVVFTATEPATRLLLVTSVSRISERGCIDFPSFLHVLWKTVGVDHTEELKDVFALFDSNSDGYIGAKELYDIMMKLGVGTSQVRV